MITGVGCHFLLQVTFPIQGFNESSVSPHWQVDVSPLCHLGSPKMQWIIHKINAFYYLNIIFCRDFPNFNNSFENLTNKKQMFNFMCLIVGDPGSIPGSGRSSGEGIGYPLQYSGLENSQSKLYSPWGRKESDLTELFSLSLFISMPLKIVFFILALPIIKILILT